MPTCVIIAPPNGAGKTTFAREFLPKNAGISYFVNADLIASGLSPLHPSLARIAAGKLFLREIDRLAESELDFSFETTLSGLNYLRRIAIWKASGYRVEMVYLRLNSIQLALKRIASRVKQGGHDVPKTDVARRFERGWNNFKGSYRLHADVWSVYDNSGRNPQLLEKWP